VGRAGWFVEHAAMLLARRLPDVDDVIAGLRPEAQRQLCRRHAAIRLAQRRRRGRTGRFAAVARRWRSRGAVVARAAVAGILLALLVWRDRGQRHRGAAFMETFPI